jgi:hypothetical protein
MKTSFTTEEMHSLVSTIEREIELCDHAVKKYDHFALTHVQCDFQVMSVRLQSILNILKGEYVYALCADGCMRWCEKETDSIGD